MSGSPLSVYAPEFVPSSDVAAGPCAGAANKTHNHLVGDAYKLQFEMLAEVIKWSDDEKAVFLGISLSGPALTILTNLTPKRCHTYSALVAILDKQLWNSTPSRAE